MRRIQTEVLIIGGGATGTGIARDLAMRGFRTVLVERGDLTSGTTGRYHGLLHSGARYVVRDPLAARECIEENRILRRILPHCIEDTGGFFVFTPWDDASYVPQFIDGCKEAGIPCEEVPIEQMLRAEPRLNPAILRCFHVPDGGADSFRATEANAASACQYGAEILTYHQVLRMLTKEDGSRDLQREGSPAAGRTSPVTVAGAIVHDLVKDEEVQIDADLVVNAAGAWAGQIATTAGVQVTIVPGKGAMLATNHRIVNTVINRCRMCADADIIVPAHTVAVIGTTDVPVQDPDRLAIEPWEVRLMLEEGEKVVPGFKELRMLRAWAGVRPLYRESLGEGAAAAPGSQADNRQASNRQMPRSFVLLDHQARDGVAGLITITSGKWTTYRKMAEATADLVCMKLDVQRPCRTHLEPLPGAEHGYHVLGAPLAQVEQTWSSHENGQSAAPLYGRLICECELATVEDVRQAILQGNAQTIDDIRRDVRLGMGPCQGGFCTLRAAGLLHSLRPADVEKSNVALRDFLQERWKGLAPVLWGQQLRQERLDELIYLSLLNTGHLPGPAASRLAPTPYEPPSGDFALDGKSGAGEMGEAAVPPESREPLESRKAVYARLSQHARPAGQGRELDVLVIGAGLAGLTAAWRAVQHGLKARVIATGWGSLYWHAGCIDILGYSPLDPQTRVASPAEALAELARQQPEHPYGRAGVDGVKAALSALQDLCAQSGYPMPGSPERNWNLPTALGAGRPTCLAPQTMIAGDLGRPGPMLIVGFAPYLDFYPALIASNLEKAGVPARGLLLDLPSLRGQRFVTARLLAQMFERPEFRAEVAGALRQTLGSLTTDGPVARVGFPAVLGLRPSLDVWQELQRLLGLPVFEIPSLPPSIPGIRLHTLLVEAIERDDGRVYDGMQVIGADADHGRLQRVWSEAAGRPRAHAARNFVLATGGVLGGGLKASPDGSLEEPIFHLPVLAPPDRSAWLAPDFLAPTGHRLYRAGVMVDDRFRPVDHAGRAVYANLSAAGAALSGCDPLWERSVEGIALATGFVVGERIYAKLQSISG